MANNQQLTFGLGIKTTVDMTGLNQLKRSLQELNEAISDSSWTIKLSPTEIEKATQSVVTLGNALDNAFDINLNGINFNKFQQSLKAAGTDMTTIGKNMAIFGNTGQKAFAETTAQVFKMNTAVQYSNKFINKLWESFANTAKYTAFNAIINTAMGSVQKAIGYIKDLDRSLNEIRIVSGQSAEQMEAFAKSANDAAKALGSSTTDYTDAALIYFQQGKRGTDVTERTDVTQKMANVTGESAQQVSEDLTAIWNNFYDGSKSLEYYADVITALGASTASSSAEIAQGLEKFAAIGDTVGLSYEYATAALATVVAETRQSADTVGTAFKTLFSRLQSLSLGETLEDDTTLTKYSKALMQVGISIKDSTGNLKDMDTILDEMGTRWQTLNKDQQVALAQTVAGQRQYTQLVALMDNWDKFGENLKTTAGAAGTLQKQQDIYMESTAAHLEKLGAAAEDLYASLFDTDDINKWIDGFTSLVEKIDSLVESLGGLKNIAPMLGALAVNAFSGKVATGISQSMINKRNQENAMTDDQAKAEFLQHGELNSAINANALSSNSKVTEEMQKQSAFLKEMYSNSTLLTQEEREQVNNLIEAGAELVKAKIDLEHYKDSLTDFNNLLNLEKSDFENIGELQNKLVLKLGELNKLKEASLDLTEEEIVDDIRLIGIADELSSEYNLSEKSILAMLKSSSTLDKATGTWTINVGKFGEKIEEARLEVENLQKTTNKIANGTSVNNSQSLMESDMATRQLVQDSISLAGALGQVAMGWTTLQNLGNIWNNDDLSTTEKMLQTIMNLSMTLPMMIGGISSLKKSSKGIFDSLIKKGGGKTSDEIESEKKRLEELGNKKKKIEEEIENIKEENEAKQLEAIENQKKAIQKEYDEEISKIKETIQLLEERNKKYQEIKSQKSGKAKKEAILEANREFGTTGTKNFNELVENRKHLEDLEKAGPDYSNIEEINIPLTDLGNKQQELDNLNNSIKNVEKSIADTIEPSEALNKTFSDLGESIKKKFDSLGKSAQGLVKTFTGLELSIAALGVVAAVITAAVVAYQLYKKSLEDAAKAQEKVAKKAKETAQATKEEYENTKELKKAYEQLRDEAESQNYTKEELRNKTYQLCLEYGNEALALKSLKTGYEDLTQTLKDLEEEKAKAVQAAADESYLQASKSTFLSSVNDDFDNTFWGQALKWTSGVNQLRRGTSGQTLNTDSVVGQILQSDIFGPAAYLGKGIDLIEDTITDNSKFAQILREMNNGEQVVVGGAIDYDLLSKLYVENTEEFTDALVENADDKTAKAINAWIEQNQEILNAEKEAYQEKTASDITALEASFLNKDIDSLSDYQAERKNLIDAFVNEQRLSQEEAESEFAKFIAGSGNEDLLNLSQADVIYRKLEDMGVATDRFASKISELSAVELQFLSDNLLLFNGSTESLENWLTNYSGVIDELYKTDATDKVKVALELYYEKGSFTEEIIEGIFDDEGVTLHIGDVEIDEKAFREFDDYQKQNALILDSLFNSADNNVDLHDFYEEQYEKYTGNEGLKNFLIDSGYGEDLADLIDNGWDINKLDDYYDYWIKKIDETKYSLEELKDVNTEDILELEKDLNSKYSYDRDGNKKYELSNEYKDIAKGLDLKSISSGEDTFTLNEKDAKALQEYIDAVKNYSKANYWKTLSNQLSEYNEKISSLDISMGDSEVFDENLYNQVCEGIKNIAESFDGLQSGYTSMKTVMKDYNDNGKISIDNLQTLLKLDTEYLACLDIQNGKMVMNKNAMYSLLQTRLDEAKALVYEQGVLQIQAVIEGDNTIATEEYTIAKLQEAAANGVLSESIGTLTQAETLYQETLKRRRTLTEEQRKAINEISKDVNTRIQALDNVDFSSLDSSKSGSKSKKDEKEYKDEFDRYWDINNAIEKVTHAISQLDKKEEKLSRNELISALKAENELLDIQADKYKDLAAEQQKEASELQEVLSGYGIIFDSQGQIQNYLAQTEQYLNDYNNAVAAYNAGQLSDTAFDLYDKNYEKFKTALDRYDSLYYDEMVETQDKLDEISREIKENNLTGWETELELILETKSAERDWNDFLGKVKEEFKSVYTDFNTQFRTAVFDAISLGGENGSIEEDIRAIQDVFAEIDKMEAGEDSNMFESISQAQEKLKELQSTMKDDAEALFDLYQEGWDRYIDAIGEVKDKFDDLIEDFERINEDLDHQSKMIELLYGENAYDYLDQLYEAQSNNYLSQMASLRDQGAFFKQQYEEAAAIYGEDSDAAQQFKESWESVIDELHDTEEEYLDTLANKYANTIAEAFHKAESELMNGSTYKFVSTQWDLAKEAAKDVYDEQEKIYQLEKLGNKYQEAINNASTTKAQQKLQDLYESQVTSLETKTELTKYDVELAEKRLAVAEAEAALEDAQNAKNTLKVTRNEAGNWAYQYVADDDNVDDKQQALLNAQYEAYEYVKQNVSDLKELMIKLAEDWSTTIADLEVKMIGATDEEKAQYQAMIDWYNDYYSERMNTKAEELALHEQQLGQETNALLRVEYNTNEEAYELMTEAQKACIDSMSEHAIESATDVYNAVGQVYDDMNAYADIAMRETIDYFATAASDITDKWANDPDGVKNAMLDALETCKQAQIEYAEEVRVGCIAAGEDYTDVGTKIQEDIDKTNELSTVTEEMIETAMDELSYYQTSLQLLEDAWNGVKDKIEQNGYQLMDYLDKLGKATQAAIDFVDILNEAKTLQAELDGGNGTGSGRYQDVTKANTFEKAGSSSSEYYYYDEQGYRYSTSESDALYHSYDDLKNGAKYTYEGLTERDDTSYYSFEHYYDSVKNSLDGTKNIGVIDEGNGNFTITFGGCRRKVNAYDGTLEELSKVLKENGYYTRTKDAKDILGFASGGYTGEWGTDGRMAMLHQKELVLNANDTENMLAAVSAVRDLSSVSSSIQQAVADSITDALLKIAGINNTGNGNTISNTSSNNTYNINAEFPAANDVNDIREALLSLPNLAAQRINQKTI